METVFDAVVLSGGAGSRLEPGGTDKAAVDVGGSSLFDRVLAAVGDARTVVVVGPRRPAPDRVVFTTEEPVGSGPAAALMQGISVVVSPVVVVIAVDVPFAASAVPRLLAALRDHDAAMLVDDTGRRQPLIAAYRTTAVRARNGDGPWAQRSVRSLVEPLDVVEVSAVGDEALDCDTPADLARARAAATP